MVKARVKKAIQKILGGFGFRLSRPARETFDVQRKLIEKNEPVIFDIGAHTGGVAKIYRAQFPLASIHAFEPFPQSFDILSKSVRDDPRIFCHNVAVWEKKGTRILNSNISSATNSLLASDESGPSFWGSGLLDTTSQIEVTTTSVDIFCRDAGIPHIDVLKMDVQGAEYSVLIGAQDMLLNQRISFIYSEMILCPTYTGQHKLHEYLSFLDSFGYEFLDFFNQVRSDNQLIQADVLFLSSAFKKEALSRLKSF